MIRGGAKFGNLSLIFKTPKNDCTEQLAAKLKTGCISISISLSLPLQNKKNLIQFPSLLKEQEVNQAQQEELVNTPTLHKVELLDQEPSQVLLFPLLCILGWGVNLVMVNRISFLLFLIFKSAQSKKLMNDYLVEIPTDCNYKLQRKCSQWLTLGHLHVALSPYQL